MYCPDCGTENLRSQKFCKRCGANLLAIDRAREIIGEVAYGATTNQINPSAIFKVVSLITIFGFMFITGGTIALMDIDRGHTPIPVFFALGGFISLILICRYLLRMISLPSKNQPVLPVAAPPHTISATTHGTTNRRLSESTIPYHSITEESTRQFESERKKPLS